jgi:tRNA-2-methylthio-N6-dimethylallyladenosine synthase
MRRPDDIIDEVRRNIDLGVGTITLLGQNVNDYFYRPSSSYNGHSVSFVDLLRIVMGIEGIQEVDFITSHPKNTSEELFEVMGASNKIKKHLHLPFQSGSNRILEMMNRGYTREHYLNLVKGYKRIVNGTISTDIIVGFPTETEEDFLLTKDIMERSQFSSSYIFKYSPRPRTKAEVFKDDVSEDEKRRRHSILLGLQKETVKSPRRQ